MKTTFRWLILAGICAALIGGLWSAGVPRIEARGAAWTVSVFNNPDLVGTAIWTGVSPVISYAWGANPPIIGAVVPGAPADNFSVRFESSQTFTAAGTYRFTVQVDDGARLFVDGILLINAWQAGCGLRTIQADYVITAANSSHTVRVEMFDAVGDATIFVQTPTLASGALPPPPICGGTGGTGTGIPWNAQYYANVDLSGAPVFATTYPASGLNLQFGAGSPGGTVPVDNFSAHFTRTLTVPTDMPKGVYRFYAKADDNFRFTMDQTVIFDYWTVFEDGKTYVADITLLDGPHDFKLDYRDLGANAYVFLTWTPPAAQNPVLNPDGTGGVPGGGGVVPGQPTATPAPTGVTLTSNVNNLNVRGAPDLNATVLTKIGQGASYPITGRTADSAWLQINLNNQFGWVSRQYVTVNGDINLVPIAQGTPAATGVPPTAIPAPTGTKGQVLGNLRLREGPSTRTKQIGLMPWGTVVDVLGKDYRHTWYQVNFNGVVGWAYAPWIKLTVGTFDALPYTDGTQPSAPPPQATTGVIVQAYGNMRIRSGPGFQFPKVGRAVWGTRVEVLGRSPDRRWYKVKLGDLVGWTYAIWYRPVQGDLSTIPTLTQ